MQRKISTLLLVAGLLLVSGCSGGGTSTAEESFVVGSGAQTFIKEGSRLKAPA
jgi:hypothetical protein